MPGASHWAAQHSVGLIVVDELLFFGIPAEFFTKGRAAESYGNIIHVADGVGADGCVNGADCLPPALDAFYEIATVIIALRQVNLIGADSGRQQWFRLGGEKAALDQNPAFITYKQNPQAVI